MKEKKSTKKKIVGIISLLIFIGLMVWATLAVGIPLINTYFGSTSVADADPQVLRDMVAESPIKGRLIFIGIQILQVFVALIPGEVVEIAAGYVFGPVEGTALSLLGVMIGSCIIFLLSKALGKRFVELFISEEDLNNLAIIRNDSRLNILVFTVFFIPGTPKDMLTYVVALTRMKLLPFLAISLVARIPSVLSSTLAGDALINKNYTFALILFAVTGAVSLIGLLVYNRIMKKRKEKLALSTAADQEAAE